MSVYDLIMLDEDNDLPRPISIYGINKLFERYLSILAPEIPVINFRMFNVYDRSMFRGSCYKVWLVFILQWL